METNQTKIRAASSTVIMMRKVDLDASWERTQKEDGRPKASRRRKDNSTEHATIAGRRVTEAETAGGKGAKAKVNRRATGDTPRVSMDTKVDTTTTAATIEEASTRTWAVHCHLHLNRSPCIRAQVKKTAHSCPQAGMDVLRTSEEREKTTDEISHVEQYDTSERQSKQFYTTGDAIDTAVQKRHTEITITSSKLKVMSTSEGKRSTKRAYDERGQKHEGKETARVETPPDS